MTNKEETLDWLYRLRSEIYVFMPKEWLIPMNNALNVAIKTLEQEPCDDAIDRQAVIEILGDYGCTNREGLLFKDIQELPPVQPKAKTGKWICAKVVGEFEDWNDYTCPHCKFTKRVSYYYTFTYKYCPSCGADMRGEK